MFYTAFVELLQTNGEPLILKAKYSWPHNTLNVTDANNSWYQRQYAIVTSYLVAILLVQAKGFHQRDRAIMQEWNGRQFILKRQRYWMHDILMRRGNQNLLISTPIRYRWHHINFGRYVTCSRKVFQDKAPRLFDIPQGNEKPVMFNPQRISYKEIS